MGIKSGREGVRRDQVDVYGRVVVDSIPVQDVIKSVLLVKTGSGKSINLTKVILPSPKVLTVSFYATRDGSDSATESNEREIESVSEVNITVGTKETSVDVGTCYGGYVDFVNRKLVITTQKLVVDGENVKATATGTSSDYRYFSVPLEVLSKNTTSSNTGLYLCDKAESSNTYGNSKYKVVKGTADGDTLNIVLVSGSTVATVADANLHFKDEPYTFVLPLKTNIEVPLDIPYVKLDVPNSSLSTDNDSISVSYYSI